MDSLEIQQVVAAATQFGLSSDSTQLRYNNSGSLRFLHFTSGSLVVVVVSGRLFRVVAFVFVLLFYSRLIGNLFMRSNVRDFIFFASCWGRRMCLWREEKQRKNTNLDNSLSLLLNCRIWPLATSWSMNRTSARCPTLAYRRTSPAR